MSAGTQDGLFRQVTNERAAVAKQEKRALWQYFTNQDFPEIAGDFPY